MRSMDRDEARRRVRELVPAAETAPLCFRHPAVQPPLPAGDLGAIITSLRAELGMNFPEPIPTASHLIGLQEVTPAEASVIAGFLRIHFDRYEDRHALVLDPQDERKAPPMGTPSLRGLVERYRAVQRFFETVGASDCSARLA